jgi:TolB protein
MIARQPENCSQHALTILVSRFGVYAVLPCTLLIALALALGRVVPDGGQLAYISYRDASAGVYLLDINRGLTFLLSAGVNEFLPPGWSPDGQQLAVTSIGDDGAKIAVLEVEEGSLRLLTGTKFRDIAPAWSPDGQNIAFLSRGSVSGLYVMDSHGENVRLVTRHTRDVAPTWLPGGEEIAYIRDEQAFPVYVTRLDGTDQYRMTDTRFMVYPPVWSPDGQLVAFVSPNLHIFIMNDGGGGLRQITHNAYVVSPLSWSPDGRQLAFAAIADGNQELFIIGADGENLQRLTWTPEREGVPAWRPS